MHITFMDPNVNLPMNILLIIANIINLLYNIPQMVHTYKTKSTKDFDVWFLILRIVGNGIWIIYSFEINSLLMLINNCVTIIATLFIGYYKFLELYKCKGVAYENISYDDDINMDEVNMKEDMMEDCLIVNDTSDNNNNNNNNNNSRIEHSV
jgi:MtN3 and saliva related transmembrane protein